MRILFVEDDADIVRTLSELLANEGYEVDVARTQTEAIGRATARPYDLMLLDVTLAEGNGFAVCAAVKDELPQLPVIFLTASGDEFNTVAGLSMGADDYVSKPFRPRELLARIKGAILRSQSTEHLVRLGRIVIDASRARASKDGRDLELSPIEYRLLLLFSTNANRVVTRDMMREALWEDAGAYVEENTLSVYIKRLRDKVEDDPSHPELIQTVRGCGYRVGI